MTPANCWFLIYAALSGMFWGLHMSISGDYARSVANADLKLTGWLAFAVFAFFYQTAPERSVSRSL